ncbi:glycosyltransferase [Sediminibacterium sp. C3]|uniref:glycosyltransferase n=1 Tax=Sediminibacterium sp. C3 TaxID=1267211 RepID=UPI00041B111F|nr:glycosyltransferase [Sediminibacterium sp. C3]
MQSIVFTVTNEICYDQRMQRICSTLAANGYTVTIIGVKRSKNQAIPIPPLYGKAYEQQLIRCFFGKGPLFYIEFNIKLFVLLCWLSYDIACAIDLDTVLPVLTATTIRKKKRVYDAHEFFTEMKEVRTRPLIAAIWRTIEKISLPHFRRGYTVNQDLSDLFYNRLKIKYEVIRNLPSLASTSVSADHLNEKKTDVLAEAALEKRKYAYTFTSYKLNQLINNQLKDKFIIYQGAVNHGRGFETLIPAMKKVNAPLLIVGAGNFLPETEGLIKQHNLSEKVFIHPPIPPAELKKLTPLAYMGITIFEPEGVNQYYSLANRFFDYMAAGIPQVCVNYPAYSEIGRQYPFALLINDIEMDTLSTAMNNLLSDTVLYKSLKLVCPEAAKILNWEKESEQLLAFYRRL